MNTDEPHSVLAIEVTGDNPGHQVSVGMSRAAS